MEAEEILCGKTARNRNSYRQRVAEGEHGHRAGSGRESARVGFFFDSGEQNNGGRFGERRVRLARHGDDRRADVLKNREEIENFAA